MEYLADEAGAVALEGMVRLRIGPASLRWQDLESQLGIINITMPCFVQSARGAEKSDGGESRGLMKMKTAIFKPLTELRHPCIDHSRLLLLFWVSAISTPMKSVRPRLQLSTLAKRLHTLLESLLRPFAQLDLSGFRGILLVLEADLHYCTHYESPTRLKHTCSNGMRQRI